MSCLPPGYRDKVEMVFDCLSKHLVLAMEFEGYEFECTNLRSGPLLSITEAKGSTGKVTSRLLSVPPIKGVISLSSSIGSSVE